MRSIAAFMAGDVEAARRVELMLPETGVCATDRAAPDIACYVPPPPVAAVPKLRPRGCCG